MELGGLQSLTIKVDAKVSSLELPFVQQILNDPTAFSFRLKHLRIPSGFECVAIAFLQAQTSIERYHVQRGRDYPFEPAAEEYAVAPENLMQSVSACLPHLQSYRGPPVAARHVLHNRQLRQVHLALGHDYYSHLCNPEATKPFPTPLILASVEHLNLNVQIGFKGESFPVARSSALGINAQSVQRLSLHYDFTSCTLGQLKSSLSEVRVAGFTAVHTLNVHSTAQTPPAHTDDGAGFYSEWAQTLLVKLKATFPCLMDIAMFHQEEVLYCFERLVSGRSESPGNRWAEHRVLHGSHVVICSDGHRWLLSIFLPRLEELWRRGYKLAPESQQNEGVENVVEG
ncbi:hypothetical protein DL93DRAFT_2090694 [Clavulina sp. PMI_390]|nr:hypothetical protein DL93DRAFT_2090694 [Clavulina sp. PMI_390]